MTREEWLEIHLKSLLEDVEDSISHKENRGGQHAGMPKLINAAPSTLLHIQRACKNALNTSEEYYKDIKKE